ncbi:MAG: L,D-transpeptidase [Candidatus Dormibacteria bacterium]
MDQMQTPRRGWWRHRGVVLGVLGAVIVIGGGAATGIVLASRPGPTIVPAVAIVVPGSASSVSPTATIAIHLQHARLQQVRVVSSSGVVLTGRVTAAGWKPVQPMPWATKLQMTLRAKGGIPLKSVVASANWTTAAQPLPVESIGMTISPSNGGQVGMGAAWVIQFSSPIPAADQSAVVQRLVTKESLPDTVGWHWWSATEVDGRPHQFWPLNEQASLSVNLDGMVIGGHRIVGTTANRQFTVVNQHLTKVSAITHQMQDYNGSQLVNTLPVSLGKPAFPTISGTLVVLFKTPVVFMNSATIGYPGLYAQNVYNDVAISTDGYYMHAANWDIYDHGRANVSFGCIEQNPANAVWFYNWSIPGDVVEVTGTSLQASEVNGEGDWNIPWSDFQTS